jgi:putative SOS response-associated peptidase YedK
MCNRYRMSARQIEMAHEYGLAVPVDAPTLPAPEIFPKKLAYVVRQHDGARLVDTMSWGFPHIVTGKSGKPIEKPVTNVRNYTSPFWRSALANPERRCLVPFTAFSEYGPGQPGKLPLHWFDIPSRPIASFAGVWRPLGEGRVFSFLTCEPNPLVGAVHPKAMPVILHPEDYDRWLSAPIADAIVLASPYPSQLMVMDELGEVDA